MGFLTELLKKLMGVGGAKAESIKQEVRNIFNSEVENGESYAVLAAMNTVYEKKLLKDVTTYYNYLLGYKDGEDPEIVIISVDPDLSSFDPPIYCKRSECKSVVYDDKQGFLMTHPSLGDKPFRFHVNVHGKMMDDYVLGAKYLDEFQPFYEFYRSRFIK